MPEAFCRVGAVDLCYETFGSPADPTMLLIMGLGTQMIAWPDELCEQLAAAGYHVVRFDNRDVGRSTHLNHLPVPTPRQLLLRRGATYTLNEMADDTIGLLDCLDVETAHVVGASMGGMIAQLVALDHPLRVRSLASIMSTTGSRFVGQSSPRVYPLVLSPPPTDPEKVYERSERLFAMVGSQGFARDPVRLRELVMRSLERGGSRGGTARQLAAIVTAPNRTQRLRALRMPTVVIHGTTDKLVAPSGGRATARAIPGAKLVMIEGMGHDLPEGAWDQIAAALIANAQHSDVAHRGRVAVG